MSDTHSKDTSTLAIGLLGIFALLLAAMGYAWWDSGRYYEPEQVNQFVLEELLEPTR